MEFSQLIELVNSAGFPIAMCIALLWINRENMTTQQRLMENLDAAIVENTKVLNTLTNKIRCGG